MTILNLTFVEEVLLKLIGQSGSFLQCLVYIDLYFTAINIPATQSVVFSDFHLEKTFLIETFLDKCSASYKSA